MCNLLKETTKPITSIFVFKNIEYQIQNTKKLFLAKELTSLQDSKSFLNISSYNHKIIPKFYKLYPADFLSLNKNEGINLIWSNKDHEK